MVPRCGEGEGGRGYQYARLPFGRVYGPAMCQTLVAALVRGALRKKRVKGWVHIDVKLGV